MNLDGTVYLTTSYDFLYFVLVSSNVSHRHHHSSLVPLPLPPLFFPQLAITRRYLLFLLRPSYFGCNTK
jgi:hypothetical protein